MRWKVQLEGRETGLEQLSESFDDDPRIFKDDEDYFIWSSKFEHLDESSKIKGESEDIIRTIRHMADLESLRVGELAASHVVEIQEDGSERVIIHASVGMTVSTGMSAQLSVDGEESPPRAESTYEYTQLALKDDKIQELIELRDNGDHWSNLYRIYEYVQDNIDGEHNIVGQGWWSESDKGLFKQTANSREAIGHEARHGDLRASAPSDPMDHAEAKTQIDSLIDDWVGHRKEVLGSSEGED